MKVYNFTIVVIYMIYLKKENFAEMEVTPEMRARMTQEEIDKLQDLKNNNNHTAY